MTANSRLHFRITKVMSTILLVLGVLTFLSPRPLAANTTYQEGDLHFGIVSDGNGRTTWAVISCEKTATGDLVIPATYNGRKITTIYNWAFKDCTGLTGVTIPEGITTICESAFSGCTGLTSVTIPDSVTGIPFRAFAECTALKSITLPKGVTTLGKWAFDKCTSLTDITLSPNLTQISESAFANCSNLKRILIPEGVTEIGSGAFLNCTSLEEISIPNSISQIDTAFDGYPNLAYTVYDNAKYLGNATNPYLVLMGSVSKDITHCQIHPNTKFIYFRAFVDHTNLTEIAIPDNVVSIGSAAFTNCPNMTDFTIGKNLQSFENPIFYDCAKLKGVWVAEDNPYYASDSFGVLFNKDKTTLLHAPDTLTGTYTIPDSVTAIGYAAFCNCDSLTQITIGKNVTDISNRAFGNCARLINISIAEENSNFKVDSMGALFSADGSTLHYVPSSVGSSYTVPNSVTAILSYAFSSCTDLENIIIPTTVTNLGNFPYTDCPNLKTIYYGGTQEEWERLLPSYASGPSWEHITVVFSFSGTTVPPTIPATDPTEAPTTTPTAAPAKDATVYAAGPQDTGNHIGLLLGVVAVIAIGAVVVFLIKKKKV